MRLRDAGFRFREIGEYLGASRQRAEQLYRYEQYRARAAITNAIQSGLIVRPAICSRCAATGRIEGHHPDYTEPYEVEWLCTACHSIIHPHHPATYLGDYKRWKRIAAHFGVSIDDIYQQPIAEIVARYG